MEYTTRHRRFPPNTTYTMTEHSDLHCRHCHIHEANRDISVYETDEFRMYKFKVLQCSAHFPHDWTSCPFTHLGERARRRDPRTYLPVLCPYFKDNELCRRGQSCKFAHGIFEYFLHPGKYRTSKCTNGIRCARRVCFFAHTENELRDEMMLSTEEIYAAFSFNAHMPVAIAPRQVLRALAARTKLINNNTTGGARTNNVVAPPARKGQGIVTDDSNVADRSTFLSLDGSPASLWSAALNSWPCDFNGLADLLKEINDGSVPVRGQESTCGNSNLDANAPVWTREYRLWN